MPFEKEVTTPGSASQKKGLTSGKIIIVTMMAVHIAKYIQYLAVDFWPSMILNICAKIRDGGKCKIFHKVFLLRKTSGSDFLYKCCFIKRNSFFNYF